MGKVKKHSGSTTMIHIGRKVPKGFEELPGGIHLGKGMWILKIRPTTKPKRGRGK
jgi:hypothetical protein